MNKKLKNVVVVLSWLLMWNSAMAETGKEIETESMRSVIARQLDAFASGDSFTAYAQASPLIQAMFPNHEIFMAMVRNGYGALIGPTKVDFLGVEETADGPIFGVKVYARDGSLWLAAYQMVRGESDGWRINGCRLVRYAGQPI